MHIYRSQDELVIVSINSESIHNNRPTPAVTLQVNKYSRCRRIPEGVIEYMPTKEEICAIAEALEKTDLSIKYIFERSMRNKPEGRKHYWMDQNRRRTAQLNQFNNNNDAPLSLGTEPKYRFPDGAISVHLLKNPKRWPAHHYKCVVFHLKVNIDDQPKCTGARKLEYVPTKNDFGSFLRALSEADPEFKYRVITKDGSNS